MNVNELRDRILEISHNEVAADTNLNAKAIAWLNSAYQEIISDSMPYLEQVLETTVMIDIVEGEGVLPSDVARVLKVVNDNKSSVIQQVSQSQAVEYSLEKDQGSTSEYYCLNGAHLHVFPKYTGKIKMVYLKHVADLESGDLEDVIVIPKRFHHGLVWGGLVWSSIFERGFSSQGDLKLFQLKWEEIKREVKISLASQPMKELKVQSYD